MIFLCRHINNREIRYITILKFLIYISIINFCNGMYQYYTEGGRIGSFSGVINGPHNLSIITLLIISISLVILKSIKIRFKILILFIIISNIFIMLNSYTRGAIIALIGGVIIVFIISKINTKLKVIIFGGCSLLLIVCSTLFYNDIINYRKSSNNLRWNLMYTGIGGRLKKVLSTVLVINNLTVTFRITTQS